MSNNKLNEDDGRALLKITRTDPVVGEKKNGFPKFLEIFILVVLVFLMAIYELARFFTECMTSEYANSETCGKSDCISDVAAANNSKLHRKLDPQSADELTHVDADENQVLLSEGESNWLVWGSVSAERLMLATHVMLTPAKPGLATRANPEIAIYLPSADLVEAPPAVAKKPKVSSEKLDTINDTFIFWRKRLSLFSRFNRGIWLDEESFYSVCPELISTFMAEQCRSIKTAVNPFCGAGGNAIQLAKFCDKVIACDMDPIKIEMAKHNAAVYGVAHKIEFVVGDFFKLCGDIRGDVIVTSPQWCGLNYSSASLDILLDRIFKDGKSITGQMLLHLPNNLSKSKCVQLGEASGLRVGKIQDVYVNKVPNCMLLYVKSNTDNCRDSPNISSVQLQQPFYNNGPDNSGKNAYRNYLARVERSVDKMC